MGFAFGKSGSASGPSSSVRVGDGVFVNKAVIADAIAGYDTSMFEGSEYKDDVALFLKLDQEGLNFQKDLYIGGNHKQENGQAAGWGSSFKVKLVFDVLGIEGDLDDEQHFTDETIAALVGREIHFLQYSSKMKDNGKVRYSDYRIIDAPQGENDTAEDIAARLNERFQKDLDGGWMKNYKPASILREEAEAALAFATPSTNNKTVVVTEDEEAPF